MNPNCFVGLPVPPEGWYPRLLPPLPPRFRAFHAQDLHFTVAFFGPVPLAAALAAWQDVVVPLSPRGPVRLRLGRVSPMGNPRRYSALSVEPAAGGAVVSALIAQLRDPLLAAAGARPDPRTPRPHLTVARPQRAATEADRRRGLAWAGSVDLSAVEVLLDRLALYTWAEDRRERLFRVVAQRPL